MPVNKSPVSVCIMLVTACILTVLGCILTVNSETSARTQEDCYGMADIGLGGDCFLYLG